MIHETICSIALHRYRSALGFGLYSTLASATKNGLRRQVFLTRPVSGKPDACEVIVSETDPVPWWAALDDALAGEVDPIELLSLIGRYQRWLAALERRTVDHARRSGASWDDVGTALDIARQSALGRFARQAIESSVTSPENWVLAPQPE